MQKALIVLFLTISLATYAAAENSLREALRGQTFAAAEQALAEANNASASVLAPETYRTGASAFKKAQTAFDNESKLDRVRSFLAEAEAAFTTAASTATTVKTFVDKAFEARLDALGAEAKIRSPKIWQKAELELYEAASRAEQGNERRVMKFATKAEILYREAELAAIETALFTEIEGEIEAARKLDADDWAPKSYRSAMDLLNEARSELASNRYDTDRPRDLATQAYHYAKHAQHIARLADDIDDRDTTLEDVLLVWEKSIQGLATELDQPVYFDDGPELAISQLREKIVMRGSNLAKATAELSESEARTRMLSEELLQLQVALEGQEVAKTRLNERLAQQEMRKQKLRRIENTFTPLEAQVLRVQDRLVIRLVGLGFTSGSATIEERQHPILEKLQRALTEFPEVPVTIEGHTDSHGVDADNMQLSIARSEAVSNYLLDNTPISPTNVSAVGYGESRPIANNETSEGRARNRRIDVVLYP